MHRIRRSLAVILPLCFFMTACGVSQTPATMPQVVIPPDPQADPFDCVPARPVPESATTHETVTVDRLTIQIPFNPAWKGETGQPLGPVTMTGGLIAFGPLRFHSSMNGCTADRDFLLQAKAGTEEDLLKEYRTNYAGDASAITRQKTGSFETIIVPPPDALCPSPVITILDAGQNYEFTFSCEGFKHYDNPLQELENIVEGVELTK